MSVQRFEDTLDLFIPETPDSHVKPFTRPHHASVKSEGMLGRFPEFGMVNGSIHHLRCGKPAIALPSKRMREASKPGLTIGFGNGRPEELYCPCCGRDEEPGDEEQ